MSQAIALLVTPLLTRLYGPADFGAMTLLTSISGIAAIVATGRYDLAIVLPKRDANATNLVAVSLIIAAAVAAAVTILAVIVQELGLFQDALRPLGPWVYALFPAILGTASHQALYYYANRTSRYGAMSSSRVVQALVTAATRLALGVGNSGKHGLIAGVLTGQIASVIIVARTVRFTAMRAVRWQRICAMARKYQQFPRHLVASHGIGVVSTQLPYLSIAALFSADDLGVYSFAAAIVAVPTQLVASAAGDVFRQEAARAFAATGRFDELYKRTLVTGLILAPLPFALVMIFGPQLFGVVFGETWRAAGELGSMLAVSGLVRFICNPMDKGGLIVGNTGYIFVWHLSRLLLGIAAVAVVFYGSLSLHVYVWMIVLLDVLHYLWDAIVEYRFSCGHRRIWMREPR